MSPREGQVRPFKRIKLKITLEGNESSIGRAHRALKESKLDEGRLTRVFETTDPSEAIKEVARVAEATRDAPKDF